MKKNWPKQIWIVRHGESAGKVARDAADLAGHARIDIAERDVDVPLSKLGQQQSDALAAWFGDLPLSDQPNVILASPLQQDVFSIFSRLLSEPMQISRYGIPNLNRY